MKTVHDFCIFLQREDALEAYIEALHSKKQYYSYITSEYIQCSVYWSDTKEGGMFWCNLHYKWGTAEPITIGTLIDTVTNFYNDTHYTIPEY